MLVRQLIELLHTLPQDLPVYLGDWSEGHAPDVPIDHVEAGHEDNGPQLLPRVKEGHSKRVVIG